MFACAVFNILVLNNPLCSVNVIIQYSTGQSDLCTHLCLRCVWVKCSCKQSTQKQASKQHLRLKLPIRHISNLFGNKTCTQSDYHTDAHTKTIYTSIHTCLHWIYLYAENCISMKQEFCHISPENFIKNTTLLQLLCTRIRPLEFNAMHHSISQKRKQHTCIATIAVQSFKKSTTCI